MMTEQTFNQLAELRMHAMARTLRAQLDDSQSNALCFEQRIGHIVDAEWSERQQKRLQRRLKTARLRDNACVEDIDYQQPRGIDKSVLQRLITCTWVKNNQNILVCGPTGIGKTFILCALANKACRDGFTAVYRRVTRLCEELRVARADGSLAKLLSSLAKTDVLILDDWGLSPLQQQARHDLLEVIEDRYGNRSTVVASQLPTAQWHTYLDEPTIADAFLDRLVHNAHLLNLKGPSMRKVRKALTVEEHAGN